MKYYLSNFRFSDYFRGLNIQVWGGKWGKMFKNTFTDWEILRVRFSLVNVSWHICYICKILTLILIEILILRGVKRPLKWDSEDRDIQKKMKPKSNDWTKWLFTWERTRGISQRLSLCLSSKAGSFLRDRIGWLSVSFPRSTIYNYLRQHWISSVWWEKQET